MSTKIGHFEILSELAKSPTGAVYKANDPESGQTVALKAIQLSAFGDQAAELEKALLAEAESTKSLSSPNITPVFGAGEMDGQFCATMEYVQGNSIATMLARKEGFSIWDLLDIGRQLCSGLDYVASKNIVHYSLEPSKIMCGWDGTVRILGFGVSSLGNFVQHVSEGLPTILHYMSPEQLRGEAMGGRSNLFTLGAIFYEMVTEQRAFDRDDMEGLRQCILKASPVPPIQVNPKVHPLLSELILKAMSKDPAERFQSGRDLLDELEKCKESKAVAKKAEPAKGTMAPPVARAAAQSKFVGAAPAKPVAPPMPPAPRPAAPAAVKPAAPVQSSLARPASPAAPASRPAQNSTLAKPASSKLAAPSTLAKPSSLAAPKAAAAAAGVGAGSSSASAEVPELDLSDSTFASEAPSASMSSAVAEEPQVETFERQAEEDGPKIAIDPMMAEGGSGGNAGTSFSEISELPPLKEVYVAPPPPPPVYEAPAPTAAPAPTVFRGGLKDKEEKPKVQPRVVAQKAIKEIKGVPPKLMMYALGAAGALILVIGIGVTVYIHMQNSDDDAGAAARTAAPVAEATEQPEQPAPKPKPPVPAPAASQPEEISEPVAPAAEPAASSRSRNAHKKAPAPPAVIAGQLSVDSTPQGAQVQLDGRTDPSWVTPVSWPNIPPGAHSVTVSKPGYSTDTRTVQVASGNRATSVVHLSQLMATLVVKSDPAGASIYVDGRDMRMKTPAQVSVDKGQHVVLVRMMGYLDETMNAQFALGQTFNFSPTLRALGNADTIHSVGKMSKLFGGKGVQAGQATLSVRTTPKGAQVAINQHLMDKNSPLDVALDPGNYVIDITLSGYQPVHKVITADKSGKVVVDEILQRE